MTVNLKKYAEENDLNFLGEKEVGIQIPLLDSEKIELGTNQSQKLNLIKNLKDNLQEVTKQYKAKITEAEGVVSEITSIITVGYKIVKKNLPCFYDPREHSRQFMDPETGEIVETAPGDTSCCVSHRRTALASSTNPSADTRSRVLPSWRMISFHEARHGLRAAHISDGNGPRSWSAYWIAMARSAFTAVRPSKRTSPLSTSYPGFTAAATTRPTSAWCILNATATPTACR